MSPKPGYEIFRCVPHARRTVSRLIRGACGQVASGTKRAMRAREKRLIVQVFRILPDQIG